jgi:hypothetical protein
MEKGGNLTLQTQYVQEIIPKTINITISDTGVRQHVPGNLRSKGKTGFWARHYL